MTIWNTYSRIWPRTARMSIQRRWQSNKSCRGRWLMKRTKLESKLSSQRLRMSWALEARLHEELVLSSSPTPTEGELALDMLSSGSNRKRRSWGKKPTRARETLSQTWETLSSDIRGTRLTLSTQPYLFIALLCRHYLITVLLNSAICLVLTY